MTEIGARILIVKDCRDDVATGEIAIYEGKFRYSDFAPHNPRFRLDDGSKIWGIECWWIEESNAKDVMDKVGKS